MTATILAAAEVEASQVLGLSTIDWAMIVLYFTFVLFIGWYLKRFTKTGEQFFMAGRGMTAWIAGLAFISTNLGSQETMGYSSSTYQYGMVMNHAYWIGAIPAILFLSLVMMPFYHICKTHSVPGYLRLRYSEPSRALAAISFAFITILMSGINMFGMAKAMQTFLGWNLHYSIWISSLTVCFYVMAGGLLSAIFNEVLQFFLIWLGCLLIPILGFIETGGWSGMVARITENAAKYGMQGDYTHLWSVMTPEKNPVGMHWFAVIFGWGLAISFGYWTTDFLVVQRVMSAKDVRSAQTGTIIGGFFKMMVPLIVILPGLLALAVLPYRLWPENSPEAQAGAPTYNAVLPLMMKHYFGPGLLGLGVLSLIAGFMSGMAGNVSAFATVWTYDIYRPLIRPAIERRTKKHAGDAHYVSMGRWCTLLGVLISIGTAYLTLSFENIMTYAQFLFVIFVVPLFVPVILGMLWKRTTAPAAFWSLLAGILTAIGLFAYAYMHPTGLDMTKVNPDHVVRFTFSRLTGTIATNVWTAWWTFLAALIVGLAVTAATRPKPESELKDLVYGLTPIPSHEHLPLRKRPVFWAGVLFVAFVILNIIFW